MNECAVQFSKRTLERLQLNSATMVDMAFLQSAEIETVLEDVADRFVLQLRAHIWGEHVDTVELKHPADWWQAFRERWFPKRWLKKHPVQYTRKVVDLRAVYPGFVPAVPDQDYRLTMYSYDAFKEEA